MSNNVEVIIVKNEEEGGQKAFDLMKKELTNGLEVIGLATGSTPETLYEKLVQSDLDFSDVVSINLDEYVGLSADHPQSYHQFMNDQLFDEKEFKANYLPDGLAEEESEIKRYNQLLEEHPVDLQILGIGVNAHIAFNEPGASFDGRTQKVKLTDETIEANKRFFESADDVPRYAYSMGLQSIMDAKKIILLAYGENKADAVQKAIEGPVTEEVPASILQRHPNVIFIIDEAAAQKLN